MNSPSKKRDQELAEELRVKVKKGLEQLERGEYAEYTDKSLHQLFDDISTRGREWLKSRNQ